MKIAIYTDGAARGNPGPGGYGVILISKQGHYKEMSAGYRKTTNNRMELLSVIMGLQALKKPCDAVTIFSDSKYVVDSVEKGWLDSWIKKGFKGKKNVDLWLQYLKVSQPHKVSFEWVKGHAGNKYNERCDQLAVTASQQKNLLVDEGYERENKKNLFS